MAPARIYFLPTTASFSKRNRGGLPRYSSCQNPHNLQVAPVFGFAVRLALHPLLRFERFIWGRIAALLVLPKSSQPSGCSGIWLRRAPCTPSPITLRAVYLGADCRVTRLAKILTTFRLLRYLASPCALHSIPYYASSGLFGGGLPRYSSCQNPHNLQVAPVFGFAVRLALHPLLRFERFIWGRIAAPKSIRQNGRQS